MYAENLQTKIDEVRNELLKFEEDYGYKSKGYSWQDSMVKDLEEERKCSLGKF